MTAQTYLAVDLGADSGRVMAGRFVDGRVTLHEVHRFPNGPVHLGESLRWNILGLWSEIETGLEKSATEYGNSVVSVGVDTWGVDFVLMTARGELVGQPYHYRDRRTAGQMEKAFGRLSRRDIFHQTGLQFMEINSLYQLLAMQETEPHLLKTADCLLMIPDFFHWCLCGSRVVEFTNATTTQMYHPVHRDWSIDLLRSFELPTDIFPQVVDPGTKLGTLRLDIGRRSGLGRISVVAPATHDTGSAVAAVPLDQTGRTAWAYISSGTWSLIGVEVSEAIITDDALRMNVTNEGGIDGTFRLLKNVMGLWLAQSLKRSFSRAGRNYSWDALLRQALEAESMQSFFDPDHPDLFSPDNMATAIRELCRRSGQSVPETDGDLVRCAMESLALKYRVVLDDLESLIGHRIEVIHIVGGGSKNELLNQCTADASKRPVIAGPVEATAMGNVLTQAKAAGELSTLADIRSVVRCSTDCRRYEAAGDDKWDEAYSRFRAIVG